MLAETVINRPLVISGRCTMGIYVMHIIVIAAVRAAGVKVLHLGPGGVIIGCTVLAVILPLAAQIVANWLGIARFMGLKTRVDDVFRRGTAITQAA
ncbi:hypothetical protein AJ87_37570 [Rhizobium yanglingense]|nr:hypothetical protein AJ87_37570 [Rhizobium yanglingense]